MRAIPAARAAFCVVLWIAWYLVIDFLLMGWWLSLWRWIALVSARYHYLSLFARA